MKLRRARDRRSLDTCIAFVDGANLYVGVKREGWAVDHRRFRVWLEEKFGVTKAYLFIGLIEQNTELYHDLQEAGFSLIFKPTVVGADGAVKGNCDADMVLRIVSGAYEGAFDTSVLVTSDGDFYSTVEFLQKRDMLARIISPSPNCSILLKRTNAPITYMHEIRRLVEYKKKRPPAKTEHRKGSFRGVTGRIVSSQADKIKGRSPKQVKRGRI